MPCSNKSCFLLLNLLSGIVASASSNSTFLPTGIAGQWYDSPFIGPGVVFGNGGPFVRVVASRGIPSAYIPAAITSNLTLILAKPSSLMKEQQYQGYNLFSENADLISIFVGDMSITSKPNVIQTNSSSLKRTPLGSIPPGYPGLEFYKKQPQMIYVSPDRESLIFPYHRFQQEGGSVCFTINFDANDPRNRNDIFSSAVGIESFNLNQSILYDGGLSLGGGFSNCCTSGVSRNCFGSCSCKNLQEVSNGQRKVLGKRGGSCGSGQNYAVDLVSFSVGMESGITTIFSSRASGFISFSIWRTGSPVETFCSADSYFRAEFPILFSASSIFFRDQEPPLSIDLCSGTSCMAVAMRDDGLLAIMTEEVTDTKDGYGAGLVCFDAFLTCSMSFFDPTTSTSIESVSWTKIISTKNSCSTPCSGNIGSGCSFFSARDPVTKSGLCMTPTFQFDALGVLHVSSSSLAGVNSPISINTTNITVGNKTFVPIRTPPSVPDIPWTPSPPDYTTVITFSGLAISALPHNNNGTALWTHDATSCEINPDCPPPCSGTGVSGGCKSRARGYYIKEALVAADGTVYALFFIENGNPNNLPVGSPTSFIYAIDSSKNNPGAFLWMFTGAGGETSPIGMLLGPDETLYVTGSALFALSPCPAGYSCDEYSVSTKCPAGYHQPKRGQRLCIPCSAGSYQPLSGQASCLACLAGSFSLETGSVSRSTCLQCEPGTYSSVTGANSSTVCLPCQKGSYSSQSGSLTCTSCPPGTWSSSGSSECSPCPDGFYSNVRGLNSSSLCSQCPQGTYGGGGIVTSCIPCEPGTYSSVTGADSSTVCLPCQKGSYSSQSGSLTCTSCPPGTWSSSGSSECSPCPDGFYSNVRGLNSSSLCSQCPQGTYGGGGIVTSCIACSSGFYGIENPLHPPSNESMGCAPCPAGTFSSSGALSCTFCAVGFYSEKPKSVSCSACPSGTYGVLPGSSNQSIACQQCPPGTYNELTGQTRIACINCPAGTASNTKGSSSSTTCISCNPGSYAVAGSSICTPCNAGTYSSTTNSESCLPCPRGTYLPTLGGSSLSQCRACPVGTSTAVSGTIDDADCVAGSFVCPIGTQSINKNGPSSISDCVPLLCPYPLQPSSIDGSIVSQNSLGFKCRGCARGSSGSYSTRCSVCNSGDVCPGLLGVPLPNGSSLHLLSQSPLSSTWLCPGGTFDSVSPLKQTTSTTALDAGSSAVLGTGVVIVVVTFLSLCALFYSPKTLLASSHAHRESNIRMIARRSLEILDSFSLLHHLKEGDVIKKRSTALGGAFTITGASTLVVLSAILALRRQADNTLVQQSLAVLDAPTLFESNSKPWTLISALSARWGRSSSSSSSSSSSDDVLPSLIRIRAIVAGDSDSSCGSLTSSNWTAVGLDSGRFTFHKELSEQPCASGIRHTTSSRGQASIFQLQWTCDDCLLSPQSELSFQLPFSCQSIAMEVSAAAAGGSISILRGDSDEDIKNGGLLTNVEWNVLPLLDEIYDRRPAATQTARRGYTLIDGGTVVTRASANDGTFGLITPASSFVSVRILLPLQPYFSRTTLSEKTTLLDLFASIIGLGGLFSVFGILFQLAEKSVQSPRPSLFSKSEIETEAEKPIQSKSIIRRTPLSSQVVEEGKKEIDIVESKNPLFTSENVENVINSTSEETEQWVEYNQDGAVFYVSPTGQSVWELPEGVTAVKEQ